MLGPRDLEMFRRVIHLEVSDEYECLGFAFSTIPCVEVDVGLLMKKAVSLTCGVMASDSFTIYSRPVDPTLSDR